MESGHVVLNLANGWYGIRYKQECVETNARGAGQIGTRIGTCMVANVRGHLYTTGGVHGFWLMVVKQKFTSLTYMYT